MFCRSPSPLENPRGIQRWTNASDTELRYPRAGRRPVATSARWVHFLAFGTGSRALGGDVPGPGLIGASVCLEGGPPRTPTALGLGAPGTAPCCSLGRGRTETSQGAPESRLRRPQVSGPAPGLGPGCSLNPSTPGQGGRVSGQQLLPAPGSPAESRGPRPHRPQRGYAAATSRGLGAAPPPSEATVLVSGSPGSWPLLGMAFD